eukprot:2539945-Rhodomonas_salina.1
MSDLSFLAPVSDSVPGLPVVSRSLRTALNMVWRETPGDRGSVQGRSDHRIQDCRTASARVTTRTPVRTHLSAEQLSLGLRVLRGFELQVERLDRGQ